MITIGKRLIRIECQRCRGVGVKGSDFLGDRFPSIVVDHVCQDCMGRGYNFHEIGGINKIRGEQREGK